MNLDIVFYVIHKRWMQVALLVFIATVLTGGILFFQKPSFRSIAVFTAANPNLGDRSNIYRTEFWQEYVYYGGELDNDRLMALARSEEMHRFLVDSFDLVHHYEISGDEEQARQIAVNKFKKNVRVNRNELGHIKVSVWDTDKQLAPAIANAIVKKTNEKSIASLNAVKLKIVQKLKSDFKLQEQSLREIELQLQTGNDALLTSRKADLINRLNETEKLIQQFNTSINEVSALFIIEEALPALNKDKPKVLLGMIVAAIVSFVFAVLLLLMVEWKPANKKN